MKYDDGDEWDEGIDSSSMQVLHFPQKTLGGCTCKLGRCFFMLYVCVCAWCMSW
jgi:hypothetical protein